MAGIAPLLDPAPEIRRRQVHLARRHHRRGLERLRHLAHLAGEDLERFPEEAGHVRRHRARAPSPTSSPISTRTCSTPTIKLVAGYPGTADDHARDGARRGRRRSAACRGARSRRSAQNWFKDKKINVLVQAALQKDPDIPDVPLALDLAKTEEQRQILKVFLSARKWRARSRRRPASRRTAAALIAAFESDDEGPGIPRRNQEAQPRSQSDQRRQRSTRCSRSSTPRRRMCLNGRRRRQPSDRELQQEEKHQMNVSRPALAVAAPPRSAWRRRTAQSVEEFYKGKSITLAIGFTPGGGYDLYARHLARHMGKHIPGRPTIVPQNMAGAGSLRAANFIYSAAPKDGTASAPSRAPPGSTRCSKAARPSTAPSSPGSAASPTTSPPA